MTTATAPPPPAPARQAPPPSPPGGTPARSAPRPVGGIPEIRTGAAEFEAPRILLNATEGWGKTSTSAYAPKPLILMAAGETGYLDLLSGGLVPEVPYAICDTWQGTMGLLHKLSDDPGGMKTLALDALGGFERLCHQYVCDTSFDGDWGEKGFLGWNRGTRQAVGEWIKMLNLLDKIRSHGVSILLLGHSQVISFRNPTGPDFDQYGSDLAKETWAVTHKWASAVLFGRFVTVTKKEKGKDREIGIGGHERVLETEGCDAWKAKNRYGMPPQIRLPNDHTAAWNTIWAAISKGNKR